MQNLNFSIPAVFEGPLDLLLHLVKINEMEIHEIRIVEITEQYLSYLRLMESLDLEVAGEYLVMASTLINIKLRSLLPDSGEEDDDEEEISDIMTARMLMERLIEYRKFKEASGALREREQRQANVFFREVALPSLAGFERDTELQGDLDALLQAFSRVVRFVDRPDWHLVAEEKFSVEEKMDAIEQSLGEHRRIDVEEMFGQCRSKGEMIVCLLALLELAHLRRALVEQNNAFGKIFIIAPETEPADAAQAEIVEIAPEEPSSPAE